MDCLKQENCVKLNEDRAKMAFQDHNAFVSQKNVLIRITFPGKVV